MFIVELVLTLYPAIEAVPLTVNPVNVPTLVKLLAVTPLANVEPVNVPAGATTAAVEVVLIRPYTSVVITGIAVELPTDTAPGPVAVKVTPVPEIVKLPAPELVLNTRLPVS